MEVCLEHLYHFKCDHCQKWWTIGDIEPKINNQVFCPHCGKINSVKSIKSYKL